MTPLFPSFWAGETLFAALQGTRDWLHAGALWTTALSETTAYVTVLRPGSGSHLTPSLLAIGRS